MTEELSCSQIVERLQSGPTILGLPQILEVMEALQTIPEGELVGNDSELLQILEMLDESYCDSGIFEIDDSSKSRLDACNRWLADVAQRRFSEVEERRFLGFVDDFSTTM
ncbi:hypothetical protein [Xylocopilactobacillus apis]|uniref:Uncharacterized protein n=1 Tax=Xylocopilactobacillus apis TaxID=2932183 RepID=A0AAU9DC56_9LACO|nr:hypothetical protein [Xylocopilactobacillus apis]BDR55741.1 hypothetical protein KIMC2_03030 [Xylocopilactobacillus apis]